MKKLLLILVLLSIAGFAFAEGLSKDARNIKDNAPEIYAVIKARAINEWGDDHTMIVFQINKQVAGIIGSMIPQTTENRLLLFAACGEWCDGGAYTLQAHIDKGEPLLTAPIDWVMVEYTIKKQLKAKGSY